MDIAYPKKTIVPDAVARCVAVRWSSGLSRSATLALATAGLSACAAGSLNLPDPPMTDETEEVISAYDSPTGTVDVAHIDMQLDKAEARLEELHLAWLPNLVSEVLVSLEKRLSDGGLPTDPADAPKEDEPRLSAAVTVHRVCKGWSTPAGPPDAATNGSIELTAVVDGSQLRRDLWGVATNCSSIIDPPGDDATADGVHRRHPHHSARRGVAETAGGPGCAVPAQRQARHDRGPDSGGRDQDRVA